MSITGNVADPHVVERLKSHYESHRLFDGAAMPCQCLACQRWREYAKSKTTDEVKK